MFSNSERREGKTLVYYFLTHRFFKTNFLTEFLGLNDHINFQEKF